MSLQAEVFKCKVWLHYFLFILCHEKLFHQPGLWNEGAWRILRAAYPQRVINKSLLLKATDTVLQRHGTPYLES